MANDAFHAALARLFAHEGGYANHPNDPGGPTKFGITLAVYRAHIKADATAADVKAMPLDHAEAIYKTRYWDALACDALPAGLDYCVFDYGVNSGVSRSAKVLQRAVGVADDGWVGPVTLGAVARRDAGDLVEDICNERLAFLRRLRTWPIFGRGWGRRVAQVRAAALAMARADAQMKAGA